MHIWGGTPPNLELFIKKLCVYSYLFKLQSPSKYSPFDAIQLLRLFFYCSKQFLNSLILMPFGASAFFFVPPLPHWQNVSLWGLFHPGKQKEKVTWGESVWIGRVGHRGHAVFGQKLLNTQCGVGRCARKSPIMKWANTLKESSKKFTEAKHSFSQQCQLVHWYT